MAIQLYVIEGEELAKIHQKLDQLIKAVEVLTEFKDTRLSKKWLTTNEVAELLHVTPRAIQKWRDEGKLAFTKIGGRILHDSEGIQILLQKHHIKRFRR